MKMHRQQLVTARLLVLVVVVAGLVAATAADGGAVLHREKRTLDLLLRGLAQALGYEVRPIKGRGVIPATEPPPRASTGGAARAAQKDREATTPSLPEPVTDPRVRPPFDVDDLLSYRGQQQQRHQGGGGSPATPPPTTAAGPALPAPPAENSAISQFVRANAGSLLNAEFDRTQLGRGPGGVKCREELGAAPPLYPGYGGEGFGPGPELDYQKGESEQREPRYGTESSGPRDPHQVPGEDLHPQHELEEINQTGPSPPKKDFGTTGQGDHKAPADDGGGKPFGKDFADVLFGPLEPEQKQASQAHQEDQSGPPESPHSGSGGVPEQQKQQPSSDLDGGYFGVVLGAPLHYGSRPGPEQGSAGDGHSYSKQHSQQLGREQEEVNRQGAYVGVIFQAPIQHQGGAHHGPPEQPQSTEHQQEVRHQGPASEQLFRQWTAPSALPSLQPYYFSYTVPGWASRRSDEPSAQRHVSLLEEPQHAGGGGYLPLGREAAAREAQEFSEEQLPEALRLDREEDFQREEQEEEGEGEEEAGHHQPQQQEEEERADYDEEAAQQEETPPPPTEADAPRLRGSPAAPGGSAPPPAPGALRPVLPLPLAPASTQAPPMLQLLQQRRQPAPSGGGGAPEAELGLGLGVGALWPPPPFDSAASALSSRNNDLLASTEKRAAPGKPSGNWAGGNAALQLSAAPGGVIPSAQFPVHYNVGPLTAYSGPLLQTTATLKLEAATPTTLTSTPALDAHLPWTYFTDPANHRHNFAFSTVSEKPASNRGGPTSARPLLLAEARATPATWALYAVANSAAPTKVFKRQAVASRAWAFHSEHQDFVMLSSDDDDDDDGEDSGASNSDPVAARRVGPMSHSESFGSLWADFLDRLSADDDDIDAAGSDAVISRLAVPGEERGAVIRTTRSGGRHLPTYHRDPLGYVSKYVPDDDDDMAAAGGLVGSPTVVRTRQAGVDSQEQGQPTSRKVSRADSKVEAVTWPSYNEPVLYGEALEKHQRGAKERHATKEELPNSLTANHRQPEKETGTGDGGRWEIGRDTEHSNIGITTLDTPKTPPEQYGQGRDGEASNEQQSGGPNETQNEKEAAEGISKPEEEVKKEEGQGDFVPYFARPEHYRISYEEPDEENRSPPREAADLEERGSQQSEVAAKRRKRPWYFKDPGPRYGGSRRREHEPNRQQAGGAQPHRPQPQPNQAQRRQHKQQPQKQASAEPDVWDYYGNPDNFYIPPDTLSTIVIGKQDEKKEEGDDQSGKGSEPRARADQPAGRSSREPDWPPLGYRSGTHHSRPAGGSEVRGAEDKAESARPSEGKRWSPHFPNHNPYHSDYEYPDIEYTSVSGSAPTGSSAVGESEDKYPWSRFTSTPSHYFGSRKTKVTENAGKPAPTSPSSKSTTSSGEKVKEKGGDAPSKSTARGPDPLWHLAMRALAHAAAAGKAGAVRPPAQQKTPAGIDNSKDEIHKKGESSGAAGRKPGRDNLKEGGASSNVAPTNAVSWFSGGDTFPFHEALKTSPGTSPAVTTTSTGERKQQGLSTDTGGSDHWIPYNSHFNHNAEKASGSGPPPWPPEVSSSDLQTPDYWKDDNSRTPSGQKQHVAGPTAPSQQVTKTTTTSTARQRESSGAGLLSLLVPRFLLTSPPAAVAAAAAAPTAQEVLEAVRPQVRISLSPSESGRPATVASVEPVRYEFSTETTLLAPFSTGGLSKETVSRTSSLHVTGHFQVSPDDQADGDAAAGPKSRIAAAAAI